MTQQTAVPDRAAARLPPSRPTMTPGHHDASHRCPPQPLRALTVPSCRCCAARFHVPLQRTGEYLRLPHRIPPSVPRWSFDGGGVSIRPGLRVVGVTSLWRSRPFLAPVVADAHRPDPRPDACARRSRRPGISFTYLRLDQGRQRSRANARASPALHRACRICLRRRLLRACWP